MTTAQPRIGIIGLGIMGRGMATNFATKGYPTSVWNRSPGKADDLVTTAGVTRCTSVAQCVQQSDVVFEVTADDESSRSVWLGSDTQAGIISAARADQVLITSATLSAGWVDELAGHCAGDGLQFADMPLTGGRVGAESGQLTLLVGSDTTLLEQLRPTLGAIATTIRHFGPVGSGTRFKLILNGLQAVHLAGFAHALATAQECGLDPALVGAALADRPGGVMTGIAWDAYQHPPQSTSFSVQWIAKDLDYLSQLPGTTSGNVTEPARQRYHELADAGHATDDWTAIIPQRG